jgi:hypothetical protein
MYRRDVGDRRTGVGIVSFPTALTRGFLTISFRSNLRAVYMAGTVDSHIYSAMMTWRPSSIAKSLSHYKGSIYYHRTPPWRRASITHWGRKLGAMGRLLPRQRQSGWRWRCWPKLEDIAHWGEMRRGAATSFMGR